MTQSVALDEIQLAEVQAMVEVFEASLPKSFEIAMLTLESKVPFKLLSYREVLIHRFADTVCGAADSIGVRRPISAALLTRGSLESLARMKEFHDKIERFIKEPDVEQLDAFATNRLFAWKKDPGEFEACNILTQIDKMSEMVPNFRSVYDTLSEYCHPNYLGTFGTFGEFDRENFIVDFTKADRRNRAMNSCLSALHGSLGLFEHFYNSTVELMQGVNDHFET